ncbi:uncharacterized protein LOC129600050 [Paramacrobiotus metropolitanus]|uniref:uncharacterized protein LOC129600050 n=1 Tax=Paramacrobiotus metropolitanus TaxID=2943436 RepID=UPI0024463E93|nr:uncharacterized protein LOC129600050 [Paramacrobiotus metropolitanus]
MPCIFLILFFVLSAVVTGSFPKLETDCNSTLQTDATISAASSPPQGLVFRNTALTKTECDVYRLLFYREGPCNPVEDNRSCDRTEPDPTENPIMRTYLKLRCRKQYSQSEISVTTQLVSQMVNNRAVTLSIYEKNNTTDPVHLEVIEPIRNNLIALEIRGCATTKVTGKLYDVGLLANLLTLEIYDGENLQMHKRDFGRMPQVQMISFTRSSIGTLETGTFMDLLNLESLVLEDEIAYELRRYELYPDDGDLFADFNPADVERVRRLHCDCSFAWFRNFLKGKPHLTAVKREGEVFVVGNYVSPTRLTSVTYRPSVLSVDCSRPLTFNNTAVGTEFSYNTTCYNLKC